MMQGAVTSACLVACAFLGWNFTVFSDILKELRRIANAMEKERSK